MSLSFCYFSPDKRITMSETVMISLKIGRVLPLAQAREAQALMDGRTIKGKIVLEP